MSALAQAPPDSARLALLPPLFLGFGRNTVYWRAWRFILTIAHRINFLIATLKLEIFLSLRSNKEFFYICPPQNQSGRLL
jgi:hypothetical protein